MKQCFFDYKAPNFLLLGEKKTIFQAIILERQFEASKFLQQPFHLNNSDLCVLSTVLLFNKQLNK